MLSGMIKGALQYESLIAEMPEFEALGGGAAGERRRNFVLAYVADPRRNATRAYMSVYGVENYESAKANASKLLSKSNVSAAVNALQGMIRETALPRILDKLEAIIHTELRDVMSWSRDGQAKLIPSKDLPPAASAALAMIQEVREEKQPRLPGIDDPADAAISLIRKSVKLHDPLKAMEIYAKLAGIGAAERIEIAGVNENVREAWARLSGPAQAEGGDCD